MNGHETDEDWLCRHYPQASEAEIEAFEERVGIKLDNPGISVLTARAEALVELRRASKCPQG
jgi:hypothetical protein